jgi:hypothetical protein
VSHHPYLAEILAHAGLDRAALERAGLLIDPPPAGLPERVRAGAGVLLLGDPGPLADLAGVEVRAPVGEGHVTFVDGWPADVPLHAFGGVAVAPTDADVVAEWTAGGAAVTVRRVGAGVVVLIGADVCESVVRIRQGWPVTADGVPPADGTAPVDDGILKCEDGLSLDYRLDRAMPDGSPMPTAFEHTYPPAGPAPMFHRPHADLWAETLLEAVYRVAELTGTPLARLDYWPDGISAVAHLSHDSDSNTDDSARVALDAFAAAGVPVTWCVLHPGGYSAQTYADIGAAGHEIALHYNAMGDTDLDVWGMRELLAQRNWLERTTGVAPVSNKNHYTRWEGWDRFYRWCVAAGIGVDQSRGPSKQGTVGFPFGTCHPSFPLSENGKLLDVLALPLHTQDLWWTAVEEVRDVILDQALARHGVAHFLFHGRNMLRHPEVVAAVLATADAARERGMPWWTSERIDDWERRRRGVRVEVTGDARAWHVVAHTDTPLAGAVLLLSLPGPPADPHETVTRHGREHVALTADLAPGTNRFDLRRA